MEDKIPVIALIGQTETVDEFISIYNYYISTGNIVLTGPIFTKTDAHKISLDSRESYRHRLNEQVKNQIDMADKVVAINTIDVLNSPHNVGIEYAKSVGKPIVHLSIHEWNFTDYTNMLLCGSSSTFDTVMNAACKYIALGYHVWFPSEFMFFEFNDPVNKGFPEVCITKEFTDTMRAYVDKMDIIVAFNEDDYIGPVLREVIDYGKSNSKLIQYYYPHKEESEC